MSASVHQKISDAELSAFLDDVNKNISVDDKADFKKLTLHLFGFTHSRLKFIKKNVYQTNNSSEPIHILERLMSTIELVFSKRKHLLNTHLDDHELAQLKKLFYGNDVNYESDMMYELSILFALSWLPEFSLDNTMVNIIKSFIIGVTNIISIQLHNYKYKNSLKSKLLMVLQDNVSFLLSSVQLINIPTEFNQVYGPKLACTIHLLSIINDYDISNKLLLNSPQNQLAFDSIIRKLWFIINSVDFNMILTSNNGDEPNLLLIDNLKSILILNLTNNIVLNISGNWDSIALILKWILDYVKAFDSKVDGSPFNKFLKSFNRSISYSLLKIFQLCRDKSLIHNLFNFLQLHTIPMIFQLDGLSSNDLNLQYPIIILKTLHIIYYQYNTIIENKSMIDSYHASPKFKFISQPFVDEELNYLRNNVIGYDSNDAYKITVDLLDFIIKPEFRFENSYSNDLINDKFDFKLWLKHIKYLKDLSLKKPNNFNILSDKSSLYTFITAMGNFPCLFSGHFHFRVGECIKCGISPMNKNYYSNILPNRKNVNEIVEVSEFYNDMIISYLLNQRFQEVVSDPLISSNLLLTIFKIFASYSPPRNSNRIVDPVLKFAIDSVSSNLNRNVRMLAARILPLYLIQQKDLDLDSTFKTIFSKLSQIKFNNESKKTYLAESTVKALSELAIISEGEWLCVILIKLVDMFNEYNDQHVNLAYNGLLYIASNKRITPYKMLSPFLPSIAERIVKRPRSLTRIAELLGITKTSFLFRTRVYTTPRLLEHYGYDYVQEIATASSMTKLKLIQKLLPRILATYFVKDEKIDENYILAVLGNASSEYRSVGIMDLMTSIGNMTWYILLQISDDADGNILNEDRINNALTYVAKMNLKINNELKKKVRDYVEYLLGEYVLELVQRFSETIHQTQGTSPFLEKLTSLKAIEFLINKNINAVASALGQISTCLQATLENPDFEYVAIRCCNVLVQKLETNHLISLFDIIISLLFQKFPDLEPRSKFEAAKIFKKLFGELSDRPNNYTCYSFSLPFIKDLDQYYTPEPKFMNSMKLFGKNHSFSEFTRRLKTSNKYVVQQALDDLILYIRLYQKSLQTEDLKDSTLERTFSDLVRTIFDTAVHFKSKNDKISTSCATALSIMGALDANKFNFKTIKNRIVIIHDFSDYKENADFLRHFMEDIVIKVFWASNDPSKQLFSAYVMQKFLQVLKLDVKVLDPSTQDYFSEVWNSFSDVAKSTLAPLLSSKYFTSNPKYDQLTLPYYRVGMRHEKWLADFTSNLLKRPSFTPNDDSIKDTIFKICSLLIKDQDISICHYLLKYAALSHIISGDEDISNGIKDEFLAILGMDTHGTFSSDRLELIRSCYQSIFEVLDYFNEWRSVVTQYLSNNKLTKVESNRLKGNLNLVDSFLSKIPTNLIALKSAECDSYERTILYLEKCYRDGQLDDFNKIQDLDAVSALQSMYASINDYDALDGILKKFSTNNLNEKLQTFQYNENWWLAQESFQVLSEVGIKKIENNTNLFKSLSDHALYDEVLSTLSSRVNFDKPNKIPIEWSMVGLQAASVSGDIDQINKWLFVSDSCGKAQDIETLINYRFAQALKALFGGDTEKFNEQVNDLYKIIGQSLVPSISSSFSRNSTLMSQLHSIYDVSMISGSRVNDEINQTYEHILRDRLSNVDQGFDSQWKILSMHRVANMAVGNSDKISDILLFCSKVARKNDRLDISTRCIMKSMALNDQEANLEYAELLWAQDKQTEAIKSLSQIIDEDIFKNKKQKARAQLQYAIWLDESNHTSSSTIINEYEQARQLEPTWEKPYYDLGKYYNKIMESRHDSTGYYEVQTIRYFLKSLGLRPTFIFEALPKFITIWLDFAQKVRKNKDSNRREVERKLNQITSDIKRFHSSIPIYVWYTSITQMLSRISHSHSDSVELLKAIISKVAEAYPEHSLWYILSHLNSNDLNRKARVGQILSQVESASSSLSDKVLGAKTLFSTLISIVNFKIDKRNLKPMSLSSDFNIKNLGEPYDCLAIPVASNLEIKSPTLKYDYRNAFPKSSMITFDGFDDVVNVFHSLQVPKQLTVRGSDAKPYRLMVKKDDTRKDAKVVEFTTMINRLLLASTEARKRNLVIHNYAVIPLAENMGVIEFVQNVTTFKSIIADTQKKLGKVVNERSIFHKMSDAHKLLKVNSKSNLSSAMDDVIKLFEKICHDNQPVSHKWFIDQFSDPTAWYIARYKFTRSAAVMSIVGYIIGLGDRHCENILIFKNTGSVLHIDFDCLFDKGLSLPTPEIVPFRLTQNITDAMGISGIEGVFRIACEVTGSLLRENEAPLMNILETLLYDPLLDWKTQQNPQEHLKKVQRKIRGLVDEKEGLPMNIHGQVDVLIQESTSIENLSRMYPGWSPYL